ncbi:hypothetical protein MIH18_03685 [Marinobacter sp. M3C]|jgi:hypothetical protein|uniref:hypothetical protein n=1 Tax=unclassified Marinobacter TaxID=83889 RepID=UPI0020101419|nr:MULTISPECIES: hypothetical protein [unclassified Marinobacter]MCL1478926.1 hypothetical protein [Marinobacter sp.]MCL1480616.1 hypothetical protein [Marinobacter sp.]MCL1484179.1 hypothetical protein [Marinobacter sp.]MCL1487521.1 hypothetical protein [Marinobacter sp.]UQG57743.1 hypothetical protein MIH16_08950 [Marinobacter sp. M4C]
MKWIILIIIGAVVAFWLFRGRGSNRIEDPEVKIFEEKDYYLTSDDNSSDEKPSSGDSNPRH